MKLSRIDLLALTALSKAGHRGLPADLVGAAVWGPSDQRRGKVTSAEGGGDYAAQMLLGRLRKRRLVRTQITEGSSVWEIAPLGLVQLKLVDSPS